MRSHYKKLDTRSHFSDFWHKARSWKVNKDLGTRNERRKLKKEYLLNENLQN